MYGSGSIRYDAEVIGCIDFAFKKLGLSEPYTSLGPNGVFFDLSNYEDLISLRSPSSASLFTNRDLNLGNIYV